MDKRTIWAIVISLAFLFAWNMFFNKKKAPEVIPAQTNAVQSSAGSPAVRPAGAAGAVLDARSEVLTKNFGYVTVDFDHRGGGVRNIWLRNFLQVSNRRVNLADGVDAADFAALPFSIYLTPARELGKVFFDAASGKDSVTFTYRTRGTEGLPAGIVVTKTFSADTNSYVIKIETSLKNASGREIDLENAGIDTFSIDFFDTPAPVKKNNQYNQTVLSFCQNGKMKKVSSGPKIAGKYRDMGLSTDYEWVSLANRYFVVSLIAFDRQALKRPVFGVDDSTYSIAFNQKTREVLRKDQEMKFVYYAYTGPKDRDIFREYKKRFSDAYGLVSFEQAMGFSPIIGPISNLLLDALDFFRKFLPSYGWAILLLTLLIKLVFLPLSYKQYESMGKMKDLQPHLTALKEQYKNDPQRLNQETMAIYKKYKINPLGGCLPMLIQIPVFFAFYDLLSKSIQLRGSAFYWIKDLANPDTVAWISTFPINILPILMAGSMFVQQLLSTGDPQQKKIMAFMPLIFLFIFWNLPSGLTLYWTCQNILSIGEQLLINSRLKSKKKAQAAT